MDLSSLPSGPLLAALVLGHVLADFVFQTRAMVEQKRTWKGLVTHGGLVLLCHVAALAPLAWMGGAPQLGPTLAVLLVLTAVHIVIDAAKVRLQEKEGDSLGLFLSDQGLHALTLLGAWLFLAHASGLSGNLSPTPEGFTLVAVLLAAYALNVTAASVTVGLLLKRFGLEGPKDARPAGRYIGILERVLILTFVILGQWGAIGFALTAKSVARFPAFQQGHDHFAEYFLAGTLASVSFAIGTGLTVRWLLGF